MQTEKSVEVNGAVGSSTTRFRNRDGRAHAVVILFAERNDNVETVSSTALKQNDKLFFFRSRSSGDSALQKSGHGAETDHGDAALLHEIAARKDERPFSFTTFVGHLRLRSSISGARQRLTRHCLTLSHLVEI